MYGKLEEYREDEIDKSIGTEYKPLIKEDKILILLSNIKLFGMINDTDFNKTMNKYEEHYFDTNTNNTNDIDIYYVPKDVKLLLISTMIDDSDLKSVKNLYLTNRSYKQILDDPNNIKYLANNVLSKKQPMVWDKNLINISEIISFNMFVDWYHKYFYTSECSKYRSNPICYVGASLNDDHDNIIMFLNNTNMRNRQDSEGISVIPPEYILDIFDNKGITSANTGSFNIVSASIRHSVENYNNNIKLSNTSLEAMKHLAKYINYSENLYKTLLSSAVYPELFIALCEGFGDDYNYGTVSNLLLDTVDSIRFQGIQSYTQLSGILKCADILGVNLHKNLGLAQACIDVLNMQYDVIDSLGIDESSLSSSFNVEIFKSILDIVRDYDLLDIDNTNNAKNQLIRIARKYKTYLNDIIFLYIN